MRWGSKFSMMGVTQWLILINVVVYAVDSLLASRGVGTILRTPSGMMERPLLDGLGHFSAWTAVQQGQVWRFLTFQFLHGNLSHLVGNMISLYFFGPIVEEYLGRARFLRFYLLCGVAGAVAYLILWMSGVLVTSSATPLVGASAGIFGVLVAAAQVAPRTPVQLIFFPLELELRTLAWVMLGIAGYIVLTSGNIPGSNAGGEAAHLGGAALGYVLIQRERARR
jgi:membrane associated rhomboid family serine protease